MESGSLFAPDFSFLRNAVSHYFGGEMQLRKNISINC